ncbi:hypothetical protein GCM10020358_10170 [Amorphoplanes nipponensis]
MAVLAATALLAVVVDQIVKELCTKGLTEGEPVRILGGLVYLSLLRNSGAAFSLGSGYTWVFPLVTLVVVGWIGFMVRKLRSVPWAIALGLVLGGALGNLGDRLFPGPRAVPGARRRHDQSVRAVRGILRGLQHRRQLSVRRRGPGRAAGAHRAPARRRPGVLQESRDRMTSRSLPVPDGLDGMRLDQAVSRIFGLSRTAAATLVESGDALVDGIPRPKSDKVTAGSWLEVTLPPPVTAPVLEATPVHGMKIVYSDDDIVVWTSRSGWPRTRARAGPARRSSAGWPPWARTWRPAAPPSARASCTASTSAPPG